jgi:protein-tyrosine-phosphatase
MAIGRSQMAQQVMKPPMKRKKNAKRRVLSKGKSKVQGVSQAHTQAEQSQSVEKSVLKTGETVRKSL